MFKFMTFKVYYRLDRQIITQATKNAHGKMKAKMKKMFNYEKRR